MLAILLIKNINNFINFCSDYRATATELSDLNHVIGFYCIELSLKMVHNIQKLVKLEKMNS